jgi:chemotaxis protein MotA
LKKPDLASIAGILVGIGMILLGQRLEGGHMSSILQPTAALIVFGGTLGATLIGFPPHVAKGAFNKLISVFFGPHEDEVEVAKALLGFATISRREGLLALQKSQQETKDPFLAKGLQLLIDATPEKALRELMEQEMEREEHHDEEYIKFFEAAGGFAPTIGIIGAVLGLIHVMENLADPSTLGGGIAVAFVATVYGVGAANLVFLPASGKLKVHKEANSHHRALILEGLVSIQQGENPALMSERLKGHLAPHDQKLLDKK